jgi:hypothetical protein
MIIRTKVQAEDQAFQASLSYIAKPSLMPCVVVHACNPSYLRGRGRRISTKSAQADSKRAWVWLKSITLNYFVYLGVSCFFVSVPSIFQSTKTILIFV